MLSNEQWAKLGSIASVVSVPITVISGSPQVNVDPNVSYGLFGLSASCLVLTVFFFIRSRKINITDIFKIIGSNPAPYADAFETLDYKTTIKIEDKTGNNNTIEQRAKIKCIKNGSNQFYFRFAPEKHYADFSFPPGRIVSEELRNGGVDVIVELNSPCKNKDVKDIWITAKLVGLLTDPKEFWAVNRYYKSLGTNLLKIVFPKDLTLETYFAKVTTNEKYTAQESPKNNINEEIFEGRTILSIETSDLKIGQKLSLHWTW